MKVELWVVVQGKEPIFNIGSTETRSGTLCSCLLEIVVMSGRLYGSLGANEANGRLIPNLITVAKSTVTMSDTEEVDQVE
ncbi:hypothetical protein INR49_023071, partial [Caranx melampygus]